MNSIGAYREICGRLSNAEYCRLYRQPALLHSGLDAGLAPIENGDSPTIDRLVLGDEPPASSAAQSRAEAFTVFMVPAVTKRPDQVGIGSGPASEVRINDRSLSAVHAVLERRGDGYQLRDADSAAGTQVNDQLLAPGERRALSSGDRIGLGCVDLIFLMPREFHLFVQRLFAK